MTGSSLTDAQADTLAVFDPGVPLTTSEVAAELDLGRRSTYDRLQRLDDADRIRTKKVGANARVWWQPPDRTPAGRAETDAPSRAGADGQRHSDRALERYRTIVETAAEGIYVVDADGYFTHANDAYAELVGMDRDEILGSHVSTVASEDVADRARDIEAALHDSDGSTATLEAEMTRPGGESWVGEATFALMPTANGHERIGAVRDVTRRKERERELEARMAQQRAVGELGQRALEYGDVDDLLADAAETVADVLDVDYCKVLDLGADERSLHLRAGVGWDDGIVGDASVSAVENESQAAYTLANERPVVVEDLDAHDAISGPELLTSHDVRSGISTIVGPFDEPWGILGAHDTANREFAEHDVTFLQSIATIIANAIDRAAYEDELVRQREELTALNNLHGVVEDATSAVIEQSTREEIEAAVCERLAASDSYAFAWFGDADAASQTVDVRTQSGGGDYLDDVTVSVDPDDELSGGPTGRAFLTGDVQVTRDTKTDPRHEPWRDAGIDAGIRSSAAIPVVHEDTTYGVLSIYSDRPCAFDAAERDVLGRLGENVGHAIAAAERKRALQSDDVLEIEFQMRDVFDSLLSEMDDDDVVEFHDVVSVGDDEYLAYGTASAGARDAVHALVDADPQYEAVTFRSNPRGDPEPFELRLVDPPIVSTITGLGGYLDEVRIDGGDFRTTVHLSPSVDVRRVIERVEAAYPGAEMLRCVQVERDEEDVTATSRRLRDALTDRQRTALEVAYHSGYFEWPRAANGETVAASMGVAPPTFHQHLRKAEQTVFDAVIGTDGVDE
jgi:PAS domain S-box-containing protein